MSINSRKKVFVGMSGGVDSSVTALLLKRQGYEVIGVFMRCWSGDIAAPRGGEPRSFLQNERDGCAERDAEDARRVAEHIGIPFYVWDFEEAYKKKVVTYMIEGYRSGITPNPDVMCNREVKFGLFLKKALAMGADYVATGHYVRLTPEFSISNFKFSKKEMKIKNPPGQISIRTGYKLEIARDMSKDQSYFLWTLTQNQLKHCLFPIGEYKKPQVRAMAKRAGLPTAEKKDSQGICFLGNINLNEFLQQYIPQKKGLAITTTGETVGEHSGTAFYTIGQRHLNIKWKKGLKDHASRAPLYVAKKDAQKNILTLAEGDDQMLVRKEVNLMGVNFISPSNHSSQTAHLVYVRVRYRQPLAQARLLRSDRFGYKLVFDKPQKFVAEGQSAVFYSKKGEMIGGGIIK